MLSLLFALGLDSGFCSAADAEAAAAGTALETAVKAKEADQRRIEVEK